MFNFILKLLLHIRPLTSFDFSNIATLFVLSDLSSNQPNN